MMRSTSSEVQLTGVTAPPGGIAQRNDGVELKRSLGLRDAISIIMGSIIGAGIFITPKGVLLYTGSVGECASPTLLQAHRYGKCDGLVGNASKWGPDNPR